LRNDVCDEGRAQCYNQDRLFHVAAIEAKRPDGDKGSFTR